jgi:two-component system, response regulator
MNKEVEILLAEDNYLIENYKLGANSYIVKPVNFDKFIDSVREMGLYWLLMNLHPDIKSIIR